MAPTYASPSLLFRPDSIQAGLSIGAVDPLFFLNYHLTLRYDSASGEPVGNFYLFNGRRTLAWTVNASRDIFPVEGGDRDYDLTALTGAVHLPLSPHYHLWYFEAGLSASRFGYGTDLQTSAGLFLSLTRDSSFRQMGESFAESGSLFALTLQPMRDLSNDATVAVALADWETNLRMPWGRHHVLKPVAYLGWVDQPADSEYYLYAGGEESFPYSLKSPYRLMGYPPNALAADRVAVGALQYALPLALVERSHPSLPFFLDRVNLLFRVDGGVLERKGERLYPFSYGVALAADIALAWLWPTQWTLGIYQGRESNGGERRVVFSIGFQP